MIYYFIHEISVVGDDNETPFEVTEIIFKDVKGNDIQVVGRFVQYQKIGITDEYRT